MNPEQIIAQAKAATANTAEEDRQRFQKATLTRLIADFGPAAATDVEWTDEGALWHGIPLRSSQELGCLEGVCDV